MANSYNISIDQGSTLNLSLTATDYNGNYLNLTIVKYNSVLELL